MGEHRRSHAAGAEMRAAERMQRRSEDAAHLNVKRQQHMRRGLQLASSAQGIKLSPCASRGTGLANALTLAQQA